MPKFCHWKIKYREKNNSILYNSTNLFSYLLKENNLQIDGLENLIIKKNIKKGQMQTEILNNSLIYVFHFSDFNNQSELFVNYYPLDCQIEIEVNNKNDVTITKISNYEYDAFSIVIKKNKTNSTFIRVKPLINPLEEKNKKRDYHLVINNFDENNPQLILNEKYPTLIYFYSNVKRMNFSYNLNNSEEPVVISFFIKERIKFNATILDSKIPNRIIAYKDNIIIDPKNFSQKNKNIFISINKLNDKNCSMIVKVSGNNSPFYLIKIF